MAPRAHAVRFVNDKTSQTLSSEQIAEDSLDMAAHTEHLWRNVHNLSVGFRAGQLGMCLLLILGRHVTRVGNGRDATVDQVSRLIVDQRDERGDDKCYSPRFAAGANSRKLV